MTSRAELASAEQALGRRGPSPCGDAATGPEPCAWLRTCRHGFQQQVPQPAQVLWAGEAVRAVLCAQQRGLRSGFMSAQLAPGARMLYIV